MSSGHKLNECVYEVVGCPSMLSRGRHVQGGADRVGGACRVEFLCHDINVHVPHHVSSKIPWYNLRMATDYLRKYYGGVRARPLVLCFSPSVLLL